jgi:hypothetical protein
MKGDAMKSPLFWLLLVCVASAPSWAIECGDVLGPGGTFTLEADLRCEEDVRGGLTLIDGATLDLQGYLIEAGAVAVQLLGTGTTLRNGRLGASDQALQVLGEGWHRVEDLTITVFGMEAIRVTSPRNVLQRFVVQSSVVVGIVVHGHGNVLRQFTARSGDVAVEILGSHNVLWGGRVSAGDLGSGFWIKGDDNLVGHCSVDNMAEFGFQVYGQGNWLVHNRSHIANVDGFDLHGDCTHNHWIGNDFTTAEPPCILEGPRTVSER